MKSFVRAMADRKKKFKVDCPVLTGIKDESEDPSKVQKEGQGIENLMPWESKVVWKNLTEEQIEMLKINDEIETALNNKRKKPGQYSSDSKHGKFMHSDQEANGKNDGTDNKGNKDEEKKKEAEKKNDKKEDIIPIHVTEFITPEIVYESHRYVIRDIIDLIKVNPHVIPKKSIRQIVMMRALKKIKTKPTNVIV